MGERAKSWRCQNNEVNERGELAVSIKIAQPDHRFEIESLGKTHRTISSSVAVKTEEIGRAHV